MKRFLKGVISGVGIGMLALGVFSANGHAQDYSKVTIKTTKLSENVYMMSGAGGNLGVSVGEDGVFLIDDQFAPLTKKIQAAIGKLSKKPIRFVINTHWHFDHTGGNENLGKAGSIIVAHDNVRVRMSTDQFIKAFNKKVPATAKVGLPSITFSEATTFYLNGDTIAVSHVPTAHTDGDAFVHFKKANVIHGGDIFFNGIYPFIDTGSKGSIEGMINGVERMLSFADDKTKIIPGHGPLADKAALIKYRDMLKDVSASVSALITQGKSRADAIAAKPTAKLDAVWGKGFLKPDAFVGIVYDSLKK